MMAPSWRPSRHGDALRRRYGPAWVRLFRERDRGGSLFSVELRLDCHDPTEECALRDGVEGASLATARAVAGVHGGGRAATLSWKAWVPTRSVRASGPGPPAAPLARESFARYSAHAGAASNLPDG